MQCSIIKKHLSQYIDNELDFRLKKEFEEHIQNCPDCQKALQEEKIIWMKLDSFDSIKPNPWAYTRLQAALDQPTKSTKPPAWTRFLIPISSVAVAALGIWLGSLTWQQNSTVQNGDSWIAYYEETIDDYTNSSLSSVYLEMITQENGGSTDE